MFTALTLSLAIGAPVPTTPAAPMEAGIAPKVMELKANPDGKITVTVMRTEKVQVGGAGGVGPAVLPANPGGAAGGAVAPAVINRIVHKTVELGEVQDLAITTADGKKLTTEEALKKIGNGAIVVISGDGKAVSPVFLKVFKDDTLVLASPELTGPQGGLIRPGGPIVRPVPLPVNPAPGIQIQPGVIQVQPGVIQIQIAPGGAAPAVVPAQPAAPATPAPAPKPEK